MDTMVYLVRHGATDANSRKPYVLQGRGQDNELNALGQRQAEAAANRLAGLQPAVIYASPLKRAVQTATAIAAPHGLSLHLVPELAEADVGLWEGLSLDEIRERWPEEYDAFENDPTETGYHGGENMRQVAERTSPVMQRVAASHPGQTVIVVAHNTVNRSLLCTWCELPLRYARKVPQNNCGINSILFRTGKARVLTINDLAHLDPHTMIS